MNFTEEHVTRAMARFLVKKNWEIVAVHPPDGQGPFVIPKPPLLRAIERASYHPDIVALQSDGRKSAKLIVVECKLDEKDLDEDIKKLKALAASRSSLLFALFRCQRFPGGPQIAVDFEEVSNLPTSKFPIEFAVAAHGLKSKETKLPNIMGYQCTKVLFSAKELSAH